MRVWLRVLPIAFLYLFLQYFIYYDAGLNGIKIASHNEYLYLNIDRIERYTFVYSAILFFYMYRLKCPFLWHSVRIRLDKPLFQSVFNHIAELTIILSILFAVGRVLATQIYGAHLTLTTYTAIVFARQFFYVLFFITMFYFFYIFTAKDMLSLVVTLGIQWVINIGWVSFDIYIMRSKQDNFQLQLFVFSLFTILSTCIMLYAMYKKGKMECIDC